MEIKCKDGVYVEGNAEALVSLARRYPADFSDDNIREIIGFAKAMNANPPLRIAEWLLESRKEEAEGKLDLGQVKIDLYEDAPVETIKIDGETDVEIWREGDSVLLSVAGIDDNGIWTAANRFDINEFLDYEEGKLEVLIGETIAYAKVYAEEEEKEVLVTDIQWDTDGEDVDLPKEVTVACHSGDEIADILSDQYGYCVHGFAVGAKVESHE